MFCFNACWKDAFSFPVQITSHLIDLISSSHRKLSLEVRTRKNNQVLIGYCRLHHSGGRRGASSSHCHRSHGILADFDDRKDMLVFTCSNLCAAIFLTCWIPTQCTPRDGQLQVFEPEAFRLQLSIKFLGLEKKTSQERRNGMVQMIFSESVIFEGDHGRRGHFGVTHSPLFICDGHQSACWIHLRKIQFQDVLCILLIHRNLASIGSESPAYHGTLH